MISETYTVRGSTITYQELPDKSFRAIRGKAGKEIFRMTQTDIKRFGPSGLVGLSYRYGNTLLGRAIYGLSGILKRRADGTYYF